MLQLFGYILIFSSHVETDLKYLRILFDRSREADLELKECKCNFLKKPAQCLGYLISGLGIDCIPKAEEVLEMYLLLQILES